MPRSRRTQSQLARTHPQSSYADGEPQMNGTNGSICMSATCFCITASAQSRIVDGTSAADAPPTSARYHIRYRLATALGKLGLKRDATTALRAPSPRTIRFSCSHDCAFSSKVRVPSICVAPVGPGRGAEARVNPEARPPPSHTTISNAPCAKRACSGVRQRCPI